MLRLFIDASLGLLQVTEAIHRDCLEEYIQNLEGKLGGQGTRSETDFLTLFLLCPLKFELCDWVGYSINKIKINK